MSGESQSYPEFVDGYDIPTIFSYDFLDPHILPSLPDFQNFVQSVPTRSVGYMYTLTPPMVSQELQDLEVARNMFPPPYEEVFDRANPERSSQSQVEELQRVLDDAKGEFQDAYHDACMEAAQLKKAEKKPDMSRWQTKRTARDAKSFGTYAFALEGAKRPKMDSPPHSGQLMNLG